MDGTVNGQPPAAAAASSSAAAPAPVDASAANILALVQTLQQRYRTLRIQVLSEIALVDHSTRQAHNASASFAADTLRPIHDLNHVLPSDATPPLYFPATFGQLWTMTPADTRALLQFYNIPVSLPADEWEDRRLVARAIGIRPSRFPI